MRLFYIFFLLFFPFLAISQNRIEDDNFIYWQPDTKFTFNDFRKIPDSISIATIERYKVPSLVNIQIHAVLDYPKDANKIEKYPEKIYYAPVFCKDCSLLIDNDSSSLLLAKLYIDIAEVCARKSRMLIQEIRNNGHQSDGFVGAIAIGIIDKMYKEMADIFGQIGTDILIDKKDGAYEEWRQKYDLELANTLPYATTKKDVERMLREKPYSKKYQQAYAIYGKDL